MKCKHPVAKRVWQGDNMICNECGETIDTRKPKQEPKSEPTDLFGEEVPKNEPCSSADKCIHVGDDCTEAGARGREFACYERQQADSLFTAGEETNEVGGLADHSASVPEVAEAVVTRETSKPFTRQLPVRLSEEELAEHGTEMARLIGLHTKATLDLKAYTKGAKAIIDKYESEYIAISEIVEAGTEERDVQCFWDFDYAHGFKRLFRCDTGEQVEEAVITVEERQQNLDFVAQDSEANVREAFGVNEEPAEEVQESAQDEAGASVDGEPEQENTVAASEPAEEDDGLVPCPPECGEEGCPYTGGRGPAACGGMQR